jgi:hypothetical protein
VNRHPRDGIRARWLAAVARARQEEIGYAVKVTLLYLLAADHVTDRGFVSVPRDRVAADLGLPPQRVSAHMREAVAAGFLDRRGGGHRGRTSEYVILIPSRAEGAA